MHTDNTTHAPETTPADATSYLPGKAFVLRKCRSCGEEKPLRCFYQQRSKSERLRFDCTACVKAVNKANKARRRSTVPRTSNWCSRCRTSRPFSEFAEDFRRRSGYRRHCRACEKEEQTRIDQRREALQLPDKLISRRQELREKRIDLGIAILHATCAPGQCRSREEIAAFTGLTEEAVRRIEVRALWKMRQRAQKALAALGLEDYVKEGVPQ